MKKTSLIFLWSSIAIRALYLFIVLLILIFQDFFIKQVIPYMPEYNTYKSLSYIFLILPALSFGIAVMMAVIITFAARTHNKLPEILGCIMCSGFFALLPEIVNTAFSMIIARRSSAMGVTISGIVNNAIAWANPLVLIANTLFIIACVTLFIYKKQQKKLEAQYSCFDYEQEYDQA